MITLAWKIPWTEEPRRLQSLGLLWVGHDWAASLSLLTFIIGEGNGNPLQCSCLENPRDGGAWWAVVYGVTQSRTWLKRLSSRSSSMIALQNFLQKLTEFSVKHQHESAIGIHMFPATCTSLPSPPTSHSSRLIQSPCLRSLSHTENSHCLSNLHMVMYVSMLLSPYIPPCPPPTLVHKSVPYICFFIVALQPSF